MNRVISLPIETLAREFDSKILLSVNLIQNGYDVLIGSRGGIWNELRFLENADVIYKSVSKDIKSMLQMVKNNGGNVYILDEEANVFSKNQENIIKSIFVAELDKLIDYYFLSGKKIKHLVEDNVKSINSDKLIITGHPRFDFFKKPLIDYYSDRVSMLKKEFGNYILFNLNFSMGNPHRGWDEQIDYFNKHPDFNTSYINDLLRKMVWQKNNLSDYIKAINIISARYPDYKIIIRPHPSENEKLYINKFKGSSNIIINKKGDVLPWILASKISIHYDCTTAIQTALCNKPVISFTPNRDETLVNWLGPFVSVEVSDIDSLLEKVSHFISDTKKYYLSNDKIKVLESYIANCSVYSVNEIINHLKSVTPKEKSKYKNKLTRYFVRLRKRVGKLKRSILLKSEYSHHFKGLSQTKVEEAVYRLSKKNNIDVEIMIEPHGLDTYLLKKKY